jgi:hypothetical protein
LPTLKSINSLGAAAHPSLELNFETFDASAIENLRPLQRDESARSNDSSWPGLVVHVTSMDFKPHVEADMQGSSLIDHTTLK